MEIAVTGINEQVIVEIDLHINQIRSPHRYERIQGIKSLGELSDKVPESRINEVLSILEHKAQGYIASSNKKEKHPEVIEEAIIAIGNFSHRTSEQTAFRILEFFIDKLNKNEYEPAVLKAIIGFIDKVSNVPNNSSASPNTSYRSNTRISSKGTKSSLESLLDILLTKINKKDTPGNDTKSLIIEVLNKLINHIPKNRSHEITSIFFENIKSDNRLIFKSSIDAVINLSTRNDIQQIENIISILILKASNSEDELIFKFSIDTLLHLSTRGDIQQIDNIISILILRATKATHRGKDIILIALETLLHLIEKIPADKISDVVDLVTAKILDTSESATNFYPQSDYQQIALQILEKIVEKFSQEQINNILMYLRSCIASNHFYGYKLEILVSTIEKIADKIPQNKVDSFIQPLVIRGNRYSSSPKIASILLKFMSGTSLNSNIMIIDLMVTWSSDYKSEISLYWLRILGKFASQATNIDTIQYNKVYSFLLDKSENSDWLVKYILADKLPASVINHVKSFLIPTNNNDHTIVINKYAIIAISRIINKANFKTRIVEWLTLLISGNQDLEYINQAIERFLCYIDKLSILQISNIVEQLISKTLPDNNPRNNLIAQLLQIILTKYIEIDGSSNQVEKGITVIKKYQSFLEDSTLVNYLEQQLVNYNNGKLTNNKINILLQCFHNREIIMNILNDELAILESSDLALNGKVRDELEPEESIISMIERVESFVIVEERREISGFSQYVMNALTHNKFTASAKQVIKTMSNLAQNLEDMLDVSQYAENDDIVPYDSYIAAIWMQLANLFEYAESGQRSISFAPRPPHFDPDDPYGGGYGGSSSSNGGNHSQNIDQDPSLDLMLYTGQNITVTFNEFNM